MNAEIDGKSDPPPPEEKARPRRTQAERTAESDRRMLRAATELIGERGYQGTSLAAIGERAGYSRGLVHERFGSKAGLLWVLVKNMLRVWNQQGRARSKSDHVGIDALCDMLDNHKHAIQRDEGIRAFYALLFEVLGPIPELLPEFQKLHRDFRADIERILRGGIAAGVVRADIDPAAQAMVLMGTLRGVAIQWLLEPDAFPLESTYESIKQNLRRSLAP
ncbi:MAG TPA: TetR/AcrR family transcriptional regulator [Polyangiales bacterium]|nr:TetR/AcrR family transcriptional regulator [Polyangiales bacterium]